MKSVYLLTASLLLATLTAVTADDQAGKKKKKGHYPGGTFVWETDIEGNLISSQLKLALHGKKKLTGEYSDDNVTLDIESPTFDGKTVTFTLAFDAGGIDVNAAFTGVVEGDSLKGTAKLDLGGQELELPVDATRQTGKRDVTGEWNLKVQTGEGEAFEPTVTLRLDKGKLVGKYEDDIAGSHDLTDLALKDNVLTFALGGEAQDGSVFKGTFRGKPRGDRLVGKAEVTINDLEMTAKVRGRRAMPKKKKKRKPAAEESAASE